MRGVAARAGDPVGGAGGDPPERVRVDRRVGRDHDHDRAPGRVGVELGEPRLRRARSRVHVGILRRRPPVEESRAAQPTAHLDAADLQRAAEVRLDEDAQRVGRIAYAYAPARGADSALEPERGGAGARTDRSLVDRPRARRIDRGRHFGRSDARGPDRVQIGVVRLPDDGVDRAHALAGRVLEGPADEPVRGAADRQRVRQDDGSLDRPQLLDLRDARQLPESVGHVERSRHLLGEDVACMRPDGRDPGPDRIALDQGDLADRDAGHIGDRVP